AYGSGGTTFITGSGANPCKIGLYVTTSDTKGFTVNGPGSTDVTTFTALNIEALIPLDGSTPSLDLVFDGFSTTINPAPASEYHHLADLLNSTVDSWIAEVIVQGSYWLNMYIGGSATTIGQVLAAANFLSVESQDNGTSSTNGAASGQ